MFKLLLLCIVGTIATPYAPLEYEVVRNHNDYIVGQILSTTGTFVNVPPNGTVNVCLNIDPAIPRDPENLYDVKDFGGYNATFYGPEGEKWWPVDFEVTMVGNYSQFCADVMMTGTFYPILTRIDWENATGTVAPTTTSPTTSSPTLSPTKSPTTASPTTASPTTASPTTISPTKSPTTASPTPAPTQHPESSALFWVGIALGAVFLVVLIFIVCSMFCRRQKPSDDLEEQYHYRRPLVEKVNNPQRRHGFKLK